MWERAAGAANIPHKMLILHSCGKSRLLFSPSVKKFKEFLISAKKKTGKNRLSFLQVSQLQLHISILYPSELAHQKVE